MAEMNSPGSTPGGGGTDRRPTPTVATGIPPAPTMTTTTRSVAESHDPHTTAADESSSSSSEDEPFSSHHREGSPESAGLARSLARSAAQRGASRAAVGRLPLPRASHQLARLRRVARVSDRAATGLDVYEAHQTSSSSSSPSGKGKTTKGGWTTAKLQLLRHSRAWGFAKSLATNTVLGAAVFATYEQAVDFWEGESTDATEATAAATHGATRVWHHAVAGLGAGCVHATLGNLLQGPASFHTGLGRSLVHHGTSHAVLFGSYEALKRGALSAVEGRGDPAEARYGFLDGQLAAVAVAGGLAGIGQQIAGDGVERMMTSTKTRAWPRYTARSLARLSLPTALGFVAFEYGREASGVGGED